MRIFGVRTARGAISAAVATVLLPTRVLRVYLPRPVGLTVRGDAKFPALTQRSGPGSKPFLLADRDAWHMAACRSASDRARGA